MLQLGGWGSGEGTAQPGEALGRRSEWGAGVAGTDQQVQFRHLGKTGRGAEDPENAVSRSRSRG